MMPTRLVQGLVKSETASVVMAAGNAHADCAIDDAPNPSVLCVNSSPGAVSVAALSKALTPLYYSSRGPGQCSRFHPFVAAPTFGILPWGRGYIDTGRVGGGTSSTAPQLSGLFALLQSGGIKHGNLRLMTAVAASAVRVLPTHPDQEREHVLWDHTTGFGLINAPGALKILPKAEGHSYFPILREAAFRRITATELSERVK